MYAWRGFVFLAYVDDTSENYAALQFERNLSCLNKPQNGGQQTALILCS